MKRTLSCVVLGSVALLCPPPVASQVNFGGLLNQAVCTPPNVEQICKDFCAPEVQAETHPQPQRQPQRQRGHQATPRTHPPTYSPWPEPDSDWDPSVFETDLSGQDGSCPPGGRLWFLDPECESYCCKTAFPDKAEAAEEDSE